MRLMGRIACPSRQSSAPEVYEPSWATELNELSSEKKREGSQLSPNGSKLFWFTTKHRLFCKQHITKRISAHLHSLTRCKIVNKCLLIINNKYFINEIKNKAPPESGTKCVLWNLLDSFNSPKFSGLEGKFPMKTRARCFPPRLSNEFSWTF